MEVVDHVRGQEQGGMRKWSDGAFLGKWLL